MSSRAEEVKRGRSRSRSRDRYRREADPQRGNGDEYRGKRRENDDRRHSRSPRRRRSNSRSRSRSPGRRRRSPAKHRSVSREDVGGSRKRGRSRSRSRSHSPDRDRHKHRHRSRDKRRRSRSRSSSPSSSDSEESELERRRKRKDRHSKKRRSRSRERSKKEKKKDKKGKKKQKSAVSSHAWGKYGIINETDIYNKDQEFRAWLVEERKINPETITKDQNKKEFTRFIEDYNTATLPHEKFYSMEAYERRMVALRSGEYLPPADDGYNPDADLRALQSTHKRKPTEQDTYMSKEQLMELRRVQAERIEAGKMKLLGMDIKQNMGVRMDGSMFDG